VWGSGRAGASEDVISWCDCFGRGDTFFTQGGVQSGCGGVVGQGRARM